MKYLLTLVKHDRDFGTAETKHSFDTEAEREAKLAEIFTPDAEQDCDSHLISYTYSTSEDNTMNYSTNMTADELASLIAALEAHIAEETKAHDVELGEIADLSERQEEMDASDLSNWELKKLADYWLRHNDESLSVGSWTVSLSDLVHDDEDLFAAICEDYIENNDDWAEDSKCYQEYQTQIDSLEQTSMEREHQIIEVKKIVEDFKADLENMPPADPVMAAIEALQTQVNLINQQIAALQASVFGAQ